MPSDRWLRRARRSGRPGRASRSCRPCRRRTARRRPDSPLFGGEARPRRSPRARGHWLVAEDDADRIALPAISTAVMAIRVEEAASQRRAVRSGIGSSSIDEARSGSSATRLRRARRARGWPARRAIFITARVCSAAPDESSPARQLDHERAPAGLAVEPLRRGAGQVAAAAGELHVDELRVAALDAVGALARAEHLVPRLVVEDRDVGVDPLARAA